MCSVGGLKLYISKLAVTMEFKREEQMHTSKQTRRFLFFSTRAAGIRITFTDLTIKSLKDKIKCAKPTVKVFNLIILGR